MSEDSREAKQLRSIRRRVRHLSGVWIPLYSGLGLGLVTNVFVSKCAILRTCGSHSAREWALLSCFFLNMAFGLMACVAFLRLFRKAEVDPVSGNADLDGRWALTDPKVQADPKHAGRNASDLKDDPELQIPHLKKVFSNHQLWAVTLLVMSIAAFVVMVLFLEKGGPEIGVIPAKTEVKANG